MKQKRELICKYCGESDKSKLVKNKQSPEGVRLICGKCNYKLKVDKHNAREYAKNYQRKMRNESEEFKRKSNIAAYKYNATEKGKLAARRSFLKYTYGISIEEYNILLLLQGGKCAICGVESYEAPKNVLYVDHNHDTGEIRGLLCSNCNTALGLLKENRSNINSLLLYLDKNEKREENKEN